MCVCVCVAGDAGARRVAGAVGGVAGGLRARRAGGARAPARLHGARAPPAARLVLLLVARHPRADAEVSAEAGWSSGRRALRYRLYHLYHVFFLWNCHVF